MRTILVDDEIWMLALFEDECSSIAEIDLLGSFRTATDALSFAKKQPIDLAFLDVEMPGMNGLDLATELRALYPKMIIIFVSAHQEYMPGAFQSLNADYYILKPYRKIDVERAIERAKLLSGRLKKPVFIRTFGRFNVLLNDQPVRFESNKAKEILAYLVDKRGTPVNNEELYDALWEGRPYSKPEVNVFYNALRRLRDTLDSAGIDRILLTMPHELSVNVNEFDCDYYQFLAGNPQAKKAFNGEYLTNYSWSEETLGRLVTMTD